MGLLRNGDACSGDGGVQGCYGEWVGPVASEEGGACDFGQGFGWYEGRKGDRG